MRIVGSFIAWLFKFFVVLVCSLFCFLNISQFGSEGWVLCFSQKIGWQNCL